MSTHSFGTQFRRRPHSVSVPGRATRLRMSLTSRNGISGWRSVRLYTSTDCSRMCSSRPFRPPSETTSTARPRSASNSRVIVTRSMSDVPERSCTSRSTSLSGLSSPRAIEPKTRTDVAPCARAIALTWSACRRSTADGRGRIPPSSRRMSSSDSGLRPDSYASMLGWAVPLLLAKGSRSFEATKHSPLP